MALQIKEGQAALEGEANDVTQKIVDGKIVNKTSEEIEQTIQDPNITELPFELQPANITNKQWQNILNRLDKLEIHSTKIDD